MKLRFLSIVLRDLEQIESYIARDNADAARSVVRRIGEQIEKLEYLP